MKAVGYIRVSTDEQVRDGVSLDMQAHKIRQYAELHDMDLVDIIADEGISGKSIDIRPGVQKVLQMVRTKSVGAVIIFKLDRLARNTREALDMAELMKRKQVGLHSITEKLDTESAIGEFFFTLMASLAQMERKLIGERTKAALQRKREKGEKTGGRTPYGYRKIEKGLNSNGQTIYGLEPEPKEQKVIDRMRQLRRGDHTIHSIINILETEGVSAREGRWSTALVHSLTQTANVA
ncbi:MAG: recombinase family protein [Desulfomonile tiedjei]|nr:recombinase family protein [Desulfomonile tiedjei]